jgi:hypothetical protein
MAHSASLNMLSKALILSKTTAQHGKQQKQGLVRGLFLKYVAYWPGTRFAVKKAASPNPARRMSIQA